MIVGFSFMAIIFLSHLSGDEGQANLLLETWQFLSHLSGDEEYALVLAAYYGFLSHLSGDEE